MAYGKKPQHSGRFSSTAMFARYREVLECHAKYHKEYVLFTRIGRGTKRFLVNNVLWGLLDFDSQLDSGDICTRADGSTLFLVAKSNTVQGDKGEFYKTNCCITISRKKTAYDEYDNEIGKEDVVIEEDCDGVYEEVTDHMRLYNYGLLPTTTKRFILPKDTDIALMDTIDLNGEKLKVDFINKFDFAPFLYVQCSQDNRV